MKRILVTQRLFSNESYPEVREALDIRWGKLFSAAELLPIILPYGVNPQDYIHEFKPHGVLLTGGNDLADFGGDELSKIRDDFETKLIALSVTKCLPILGICRGSQILAQHFGASLGRLEGHVRSRHVLKTNPISKHVNYLLALESVNSFHSLAPVKLPQDLLVSAWSEDGSIEAFEHTELPVFAMLWHPEREDPWRLADIAFLKKFF